MQIYTLKDRTELYPENILDRIRTRILSFSAKQRYLRPVVYHDQGVIHPWKEATIIEER